jgi:hypothetical protein
MRTAEEFKVQTQLRKIENWTLCNCEFCYYQCGFVFRPNHVFYDSGCYCVQDGFRDLRESSYQEVADHYNCQTNKDYIAEMNKFWGFNK